MRGSERAMHAVAAAPRIQCQVAQLALATGAAVQEQATALLGSSRVVRVSGDDHVDLTLGRDAQRPTLKRAFGRALRQPCPAFVHTRQEPVKRLQPHPAYPTTQENAELRQPAPALNQ